MKDVGRIEGLLTIVFGNYVTKTKTHCTIYTLESLVANTSDDFGIP